jgi:hypothetical protein
VKSGDLFSSGSLTGWSTTLTHTALTASSMSCRCSPGLRCRLPAHLNIDTLAGARVPIPRPQQQPLMRRVRKYVRHFTWAPHFRFWFGLPSTTKAAIASQAPPLEESVCFREKLFTSGPDTEVSFVGSCVTVGTDVLSVSSGNGYPSRKSDQWHARLIFHLGPRP